MADDPRGNKSVEMDQLGARTSFTYDGNSNTILKVDARSWPITYTIDALNRTAMSAYADGSLWTGKRDQGPGTRGGRIRVAAPPELFLRTVE